MEKHRLRASENRVLRRIFGPKREEVIGCSAKYGVSCVSFTIYYYH
jgi:hypothetical protein